METYASQVLLWALLVAGSSAMAACGLESEKTHASASVDPKIEAFAALENGGASIPDLCREAHANAEFYSARWAEGAGESEDQLRLLDWRGKEQSYCSFNGYQTASAARRADAASDCDSSTAGLSAATYGANSGETYRMRFVDCMRNRGISGKDARHEADKRIDKAAERVVEDVNSGRVRSMADSLQACEKYNNDLEAFDRCLTDQGSARGW